MTLVLIFKINDLDALNYRRQVSIYLITIQEPRQDFNK